MVHASGHGHTLTFPRNAGTKFSRSMTLQSHPIPHQQTMEITATNRVYLNGDLYPKEVAAQVIAHWHVLKMIDDVSFHSFQAELQKG